MHIKLLKDIEHHNFADNRQCWYMFKSKYFILTQLSKIYIMYYVQLYAIALALLPYVSIEIWEVCWYVG